MGERDELRERADMRAQLYADLSEVGWWLWPVEEDLAFVADKLWERGWRR